ncbi:hypothetical protein [Marilutibacter alkalisoli]|uniref:Uncharacterized protein n=1 Tax=Marilutibacter alkalisoli TaxID=2591633 RepID=A0A514BTJ6_9GAMM|nr:hypothetical protein [Lysobacter alkalisoli]QDH70731.1 hypothetical protein FKV23_12050 [Lysobacter alkalisoli]
MPIPTPFSHVPRAPTSRQRSRHRGAGPRLLTALVGVLLAMGAYAGDAKPVQTASTANEPATLPEPLRQDLSAKLPAGLPIEIDNPYGSVFLRFGGYEHEVGIHSTLQQPPGAPTIEFLPEQGDGRYRIAPGCPMARPWPRHSVLTWWSTCRRSTRSASAPTSGRSSAGVS